MSDSFEVDFEVTLKLPPEALNVIMKALESAPYGVVRPVIDIIHPQVLAQALERQNGQRSNKTGA